MGMDWGRGMGYVYRSAVRLRNLGFSAFVWRTTMMMTTYQVVSSLGPFKPSLIAVNLQKM